MVLLLLGSFGLGAFRLADVGTWPDEGYSLLEATGQTAARAGQPDLPSYLESLVYVPDEIASVDGTFRSADLWRKNRVANALRAPSYYDSGNGMAYALVLHFWIEAFGPSNLSVRIPSVIFAVGAIAFLYLLVSAGTQDRLFALLAASFAAISPLLIIASKTARPNSMALFCAAGSMLFFWRMLRDEGGKRIDAACYGLFSALAVFTHFFTAYIFIAQALFLLAAGLRGRRFGELTRGLIVAASVAGFVASFFFANGVRVGLERARIQETLRAAREEQRLRSPNAGSHPTILATPSSLAREYPRLVAHLFNVRSAVVSGRWVTNRAVEMALTMLTIGTYAIYALGMHRGYRTAPARARLLVWLSAAMVLCGLAYTAFVAVVVMRTIASFSARSHVWMIPSIAVLMALTMRGVWGWRPLWRFAAVTVLGIQWLLFNAVALRTVYLPRYADSVQMRMPSGNYQTALRIRAAYRPVDVIEYERWIDAVKVNLYLRDFDGIQKADTSYVTRGLDRQEDPRSIYLVTRGGERRALWSGIQNDGALVPYLPE